MRRLIVGLAAFAGLYVVGGGTASAAGGSMPYAYTLAVAPGVVTETTTVLQSGVNCAANPCSMIYRYRAVRSSKWTLSNSGNRIVLCNTHGHGLGCGPGAANYAETLRGLSSATAYEYQVGLKVGANKIAWAGPDGTSSTATGWTTN